MCQFLYVCLAFLCICLWFYVCFSVLESFWKETEEKSENREKMSKTGKIGKKLKNNQRQGSDKGTIQVQLGHLEGKTKKGFKENLNGLIQHI